MSRRNAEILGGGLAAGMPTARMTTGERYSGNRMFAGNGVVLWCCKCDQHRAVAGGKTVKRGPQRWFTCVECLPNQVPAEAA